MGVAKLEDEIAVEVKKNHIKTFKLLYI